MLRMVLTISRESPDTQVAKQLLKELDDHLTRLYPPASNHLLSTSQLLEPNVIFVVARIDGLAIGCGAVLLKTGYGEIKRVFVKPDRRGTGIGAQIVQQLCSISSEHGLGIVRLETGTSQPEAMRLYELAGFRRTGPFGDYSDDILSVFYEREL